MRVGSAMFGVSVLLLVSASLLVPQWDALAGKKRARAPVSVAIGQRAYPAGASVEIRVINATRRPIYLPGCASYTLERFDDRRDTFVPLPPRRCEWENNAIVVPPGDRTFSVKPRVGGARAILRAVVTYGVGCREGVPLTRARCSRVDTAYSRSFVVLQATEK